MAIVFYKPGSDPKLDGFYAVYTGGTAWNEDDPRYPPPTKNFLSSLAIARTEDGMKEILTCRASQSVLMGEKVQRQGGGNIITDAVTLLAAITGDDLKIYVLKGVHQENKPHVTLAMGGELFHVNVKSGRQGQSHLFTVSSISVGNLVMDDPEWTVVRH
jgi:hypothetical protein